MKWSEEQTKAHAANAEKYRADYVTGKNKTASLDEIKGCKRRCVSLIKMLGMQLAIDKKILEITAQVSAHSPIFYFHEIPHFTIDCHRYFTPDKLPENINQMPLQEQQMAVINPEELRVYDRVLREEIGKERVYPVEIKGVAFGGDGLVAQVWYDNERLQGFNDKLGERVRREVPSMDFVWGMVKNRIPLRVVNLNRFTGEEDRQQIISFVDSNRDTEIGSFDMQRMNLVFSNHYIQSGNTKNLGEYFLSC